MESSRVDKLRQIEDVHIVDRVWRHHLPHRNREADGPLSWTRQHARLSIPQDELLRAWPNILLFDAVRTLDRPQLPTYLKGEPRCVWVRYTPELEFEGRVDSVPGRRLNEIHAVLGGGYRSGKQSDGVLGVRNGADEDGFVASAELSGLDL